MQILLNHHGEQLLPVDVEAPAPFQREASLWALQYFKSPSLNVQGAKLERGAALWDTTGSLLLYSDRVVSIAPAAGALLTLESRFGPCAKGPGVRHAIARRQSPSLGVSLEREICVPTGGVSYLVCNEVIGIGLASWLEQSEWGYVTFDLQTLTQREDSFAWESPTISPPAFSPDGRYIVSCQYLRDYWWTDDYEDGPTPSPGGRRQIGTLSIHDLVAKTISHHAVLADLPAGWLPDRPDRSPWMCIWGPEFVDAHHFRFWWPDESSSVLPLSVSGDVIKTEAMGSTRSWLSD